MPKSNPRRHRNEPGSTFEVWQVKALDFGLTVTLDAPHTAPLGTAIDNAASPGTCTGMLLGTPPYMSPQQHRGMAADPSDEIYAVGVSLWEALYGQRPFRAASTEALPAEKLTGAPVVAVTIATSVDTNEADPCHDPIRSLASRWRTQRPAIDDAVALRSLDA